MYRNLLLLLKAVFWGCWPALASSIQTIKVGSIEKSENSKTSSISFNYLVEMLHFDQSSIAASIATAYAAQLSRGTE
jgi:hypothetical protein